MSSIYTNDIKISKFSENKRCKLSMKFCLECTNTLKFFHFQCVLAVLGALLMTKFHEYFWAKKMFTNFKKLNVISVY